jgi:DNA polymerase III epsilon subunit family exonuclease
MWSRRLPPIEKAEFVALDTETTSLLPATGRLVEVAAVRFVRAGQVLDEFASLVCPGHAIPAEARKIHGITDAMVRDAPEEAEVLRALLRRLGSANTIIVAHNASFDLGFLTLGLARAGLTAPKLPVLDTCLMARDLLPHLDKYSLSHLSQVFGLSHKDRHRALPDAHITRKVFLRLLEYLSPDAFEHLPRRGYVFGFDEGGIVLAEPPAGFEALAVAIEQHLDVEMIYRGGSKGAAPRRVTPLALFRQGPYVYLAAFCHRDQLQKTFRLDKITSLRLVD